ncbi:PhzF family phenazine biosynthesis protein [Sphaerisporangium perillae]|uniref:PhzF family phenazine biosynthesis protein n=1 Tax=Sphaerisporangium perillae TaxID=2935860 RepID=UPI0027E0BC1C|nr:PhzF family phenazine biosynthesis protein [Sphaerisporangium perillae]
MVDAFADAAFHGNPAGVCLLDEARDARWMQAVGAEMNLSETAFVDRYTADPRDGMGLRWFTPKGEVDLCGHATLAAAHVLWEREGEDVGRPLRFATRSGVLVAERAERGIRLDLPAEPAEPAEVPEGLPEALGAKPIWMGRNRFDYLVELVDEEEVAELRPDFAALSAFPVRGIIVTAPGRREHDFVSRFFAPRHGVDEDPVTGSAHCCLGPFWSARLGRRELTGYQLSPRGGRVRVTTRGERVALDGDAVIFMSGELHEREER